MCKNQSLLHRKVKIIMNEELKILANHMRNPYENIDIEYIDENKIKKLLDKNEIIKIYEFLPSLITKNSFYYIMTQTKGTYVVTSENSNIIKQQSNSKIEFISVDERILDIIYSYDKLPIYNKSYGSFAFLIIVCNENHLLTKI